MTDLPHIASRLFATPLLVAKPKLDVILNVIGYDRLVPSQSDGSVLNVNRSLKQTPRLNGAPLEDLPPLPSRGIEITEDGIAIIPVVGTLVARSSYLAAASGLASYGEIGDAVENAATDPRVRGLLLDIDSPGGEVGGLFDLVDRIAAIREQTGKPLWAVANESALSAAYAIACAADSIAVTQTGEAGSIGVVAVHVDESNADRQAGMNWTFIQAGGKKTDGNPHEPLSTQAKADIQADVDALYERFVFLVANRRGLSCETVRATEAGVYRGSLAVKAGLADRVATLRQSLNEFAASLAKKPGDKTKTPSCHSVPKEILMQANDTPESETPAEPDKPQVPPAAEPDNSEAVEKRLRADFAELAAVAAQGSRLGVKLDAAEAMAKGIKPDALRRTLLEELARRSEAADLVAAAPAKGSSESPIVKRAREAASRSK